MHFILLVSTMNPSAHVLGILPYVEANLKTLEYNGVSSVSLNISKTHLMLYYQHRPLNHPNVVFV